MSETSVVLHPLYPPGVETALHHMSHISLQLPRNDDEVVDALAGAEVLVTYTWRSDFLVPSLRWIAGTGAGIDQYPLRDLHANGTVLTTAAGVHSGCVAEHAFALLLACTRRIGAAVRNMEHRQWVPQVGEELAGKRLVIVGLGQIGEEVAVRANGWGMEVRGVKRFPETYRGCVHNVVASAELPQVCEWADIVLLAASATSVGSHLIGAAELSSLGSGWLTNIGRGSLVDEDALIAALESGQLRGAGLDVTAREPLPISSPLWAMPQVVITAHNAGHSPGFGRRWAALFRDNLAALSDEGPWRNRVHWEASIP